MNKRGILIVDDDDDYREYLVRELKNKDFETVEGVMNGLQAIDRLKKNPTEFQFAVIDHRLRARPDGIETTRELIKISPNIYPVIFTNVKPNPNNVIENKYKALEAGAFRYLEWKSHGPQDITDFVTEIDQLVGHLACRLPFLDQRFSSPNGLERTST
jgi:DNA-binding NtrC family response regulator